MSTVIFLCVAAAALKTGAPVLFAFALTGLIVSMFPPVILLLGITAGAVWAIHYFSNKR